MKKLFIAFIAITVLSGCAAIPPDQLGTYWKKIAEPTAASPAAQVDALTNPLRQLPEYVEITNLIPEDCPITAGSYDGYSCGPAVRNGRLVFLIWIRKGTDERCNLNHERAHKARYYHAQRAPNNIAERCAWEIGEFDEHGNLK